MNKCLNKAVSLVSVMLFLTAMAPNTVFASAEGDWEYRVDGKNAVVTRYKGADPMPVMPATLGGKTVTGIAVDAFNGCPIFTLTLSSGIQEIEPGAFFECRTVTDFKVDVENKVFTAPGGVLFRDGGKTLTQYPAGKTDPSYAIPEGVTEIASSAFDHNTFLESITIPESVVNIGDGAFWRTSALKSIRIPAAVESIGTSVFANCGNLKAIDVAEANKNYKSIDGALLTKDGRHLVQCPPGLAGWYTVPDGVTTLDEGSFRGNYSMTGITIGDNVTSIEDCAFSYCEVLDTVIFGKSTSSIGFQTFQGCNILKTVIFPAGLKQIGSEGFRDCPLLEAAYFQGAPPKAFGQGAFDGSAANFTVYYPANVQKSWKNFRTYAAKAYTELPATPTAPPMPSPTVMPTPQPTVEPTSAPATPSAHSAPVIIGKPELLSTLASGSSDIRLVWTPAAGAVGYEVWRSTAYLGQYELILSVIGTTCEVPVPSDGKRRCYKVRALSSAGGMMKPGEYSNALYGLRRQFLPSLR